jgi:hypothetical protein
MDEDFRRHAAEDIARLLAHWRTIEFWIKKAEQINKQAVIPAINELRYASRQIFNAIRVLEKPVLSDGDESVISRRIIIGEQYLFNAEHDICDAIVTFYDEVVSDLDAKFGTTAITILYPEYPLLKRRIQDCQSLISDARLDYDKRFEVYSALRTNHIPHFVESYRTLVDAEVGAKEHQNRLDRQLIIAQAKITILGWFGLIAAIAAIVAIPLSIYLWTFAYEDFCSLHGKNAVLGLICSSSSQ